MKPIYVLRELVNHKQTITIVDVHYPNLKGGSQVNMGTGQTDPEAYNGEGCGSLIYMGDIRNMILETDSKTGKNKKVAGNRSVTLAVELIHALKAADGKMRKSEWIQSSTYKDENGIIQTEIQRREELETHGIGGAVNFNKKGKAYVNENDIRGEQGLDKRAAYNTEYNINSDGTTYESPKNQK